MVYGMHDTAKTNEKKHTKNWNKKPKKWKADFVERDLGSSYFFFLFKWWIFLLLPEKNKRDTHNINARCTSDPTETLIFPRSISTNKCGSQRRAMTEKKKTPTPLSPPPSKKRDNRNMIWLRLCSVTRVLDWKKDFKVI